MKKIKDRPAKRKTRNVKHAKKDSYEVQMIKWKAEVQRVMARMNKHLGGMLKTLDNMEKHMDEADAVFDKAVDDGVDDVLKSLDSNPGGDPPPEEPELAPVGTGDGSVVERDCT